MPESRREERDGPFCLVSLDRPEVAKKRLEAAGFSVGCWRPDRGGLRHVVYVGLTEPDTIGASAEGSRSLVASSRERRECCRFAGLGLQPPKTY